MKKVYFKKVYFKTRNNIKKNNTLIIDTPTFLEIYEDFLKNLISKKEIIRLYKEQFGVIDYKNNN